MHDGQQMLGGNNEDSIEPLTKVWFVPATEDTFAWSFWLRKLRAQGGMNDHGSSSTSSRGPNRSRPLEGKQPYTAQFHGLRRDGQCATVACVVELFEKYYDRETLPYSTSLATPRGVGHYRAAGNPPPAVVTRWRQTSTSPRSRRRNGSLLAGATRLQRDAGRFPALSVEYMRDVMAASPPDERTYERLHQRLRPGEPQDLPVLLFRL